MILIHVLFLPMFFSTREDRPDMKIKSIIVTSCKQSMLTLPGDGGFEIRVATFMERPGTLEAYAAQSMAGLMLGHGIRHWRTMENQWRQLVVIEKIHR